MNDAASMVFLNLLRLAVRMMPIFICLEPRAKSKENIAAVSCYLWVVMVSLQSLLHLNTKVFWVFQGVFSGLFFLVLLIFFEGTLVKKAFLYCSAWMFSVMAESLNELAAWVLIRLFHAEWSHVQISAAVTAVSACLFGVWVQFWMKKRVNLLFSQLSSKSCMLLPVYPLAFLLLLLLGTHTIFSGDTLAQKSFEYVLFFIVLCFTMLLLYMMILNNLLEIISRRKSESELIFARQMIAKQREHYNQTLEHMEQVRIIRHDFRHHIHALMSMEREEQERYLKNLLQELDRSAEQNFCQNQAVNSLLGEYAVRAGKENIDFTAKMDLSAHIPVDDLTLCIVIGNLLENALEACKKMKQTDCPERASEAGEEKNMRYIRIQGRWLGDHLLLMVENSYRGFIRRSGEHILSSKKDGGLGMLSIRRILSRPGDEFDVDYNENTFTAMVKIADRTLPGDRT